MDEYPIRLGYELIGRVIVSWGQLDRSVIAETWRTKFPPGRWPDGAETGFWARWGEWQRLHRADQTFVDEVRTLSAKRDDMAHNIASIDVIDGTPSVAVMRLETNWKRKHVKWTRYLHLAARARPAPPANREYLRYSKDDLVRLEADIVAARERIKAISLTFRGSQPGASRAP